MNGERSLGAAVMIMVALGLLAGAATFSWFEYEFHTGRQVAPGGPYEETGIEEHSLAFYVTGTQGDAEPKDPDAADLGGLFLFWGLATATTGLVLALMAEIPGIDRVLRRRVALGFYGVTLLALIGVLVATWILFPAAMGEHGIKAPFTSRLDDPGYTRTTLGWGWASGALAFAAAFGATLWKFQAGDVDPRQVEAHRAE